jgi:hypothetical protein
LRWVVTPAVLGAIAGLMAAVASWICRRTREPALPRMSEEWLRNLNQASAHQADYWRDSW